METASCTYTLLPSAPIVKPEQQGSDHLKNTLVFLSTQFFHLKQAARTSCLYANCQARSILKHTCFSSLKQMFSSQWVESTESKVHLTRANCCRAATRKRNKNARFSIGRREFQADNALRILLWQLWQAACTLDTLDLQVGWWWGLGCTFTSCLHCSSLSLAKKWSALGNIWQVYQ